MSSAPLVSPGRRGPDRPRPRIVRARSPQDIRDVRHLFLQYEEWMAKGLGVDLSFQDFASELVNLPGIYAPPRGEILLARDESGTAIGCLGLRPLEPRGRCEIKRLFVSADARTSGTGRRLVEEMIERARDLGYEEMVLDSHPDMTIAHAIYRKLGFETIDPYYDTPIACTIFMRLGLSR